MKSAPMLQFWAGLGLLLPMLWGCSTPQSQPNDPAIARFHVETAAAYPNNEQLLLPLSGTRITVARTAVLTELDITGVELIQVDLGLCLLFSFTPEASRTLYRITAGNSGRRLVLTVNGSPVGTRVITGPEGSGQWMTFTEMNDEDLPGLVTRLRETTHALQRSTATN
ncbi:MAG: hypothetical protein SFY80_17810 [Verrucomicrobiota bacterium]|nr:hypothetical protein [Verrucomicrobiota bacterium]